MPTLRILGVIGAVSTGDVWLFEDTTLLHDILPNADEELWLGAISPTYFGSALPKHGHPRARMITLPSSKDMDFSWFSQVPARKLKKRFTSALGQMVEFTKKGQMLIISINGHGSCEYGFKGAIQIGQLWIGNPKFIQCQEVLSVVKKCAGYTTLIINACFPGFWVEQAKAMELDSGRVTIVTGGGKEVIDSHSLSGSNMFRGGYFVNNLVSRLYKEFSIYLPRPTTLTGGQQIRYESLFPESNVESVRLGDPVRVLRSTLGSVVADICHDMSVLRGGNSIPQVFDADGGSGDALRFFGANGDILSIKITDTCPPDPNQEFLTHGATGCFGSKKLLPTGELAGQYALLPFSPNAGCNTRLTMKIVRCKQGKLNWAEERKLRKTLKRRIEAFRSMEDELKRRGVKLRKLQPISDEESLLWKSEANRFTVKESGFPWTQVRDLFISSMIQHHALNPNA